MEMRDTPNETTKLAIEEARQEEDLEAIDDLDVFLEYL